MLVGLLERRGCADVALRLVQHGACELDPEGLDSSAALAATALWRLTWKAEPPRGDVRGPAPLGAAQAMPRGLTARILACIVEDPTQAWSLRGLAEDLGLAVRTLQRRLAADGMSLSRAVAAARLREAARLLAETHSPIGLFGLLAGYSDPSHFTREFKKRTGLGPREYRAVLVAGHAPDMSSPVSPLR